MKEKYIDLIELSKAYLGVFLINLDGMTGFKVTGSLFSFLDKINYILK